MSAATLLTYARNQTNTFRLNGSLAMQWLIKRFKWHLMLYTITGKSCGRISKFYKYDRPSINWHIITSQITLIETILKFEVKQPGVKRSWGERTRFL